jgi:hypothetical protein
VCRESAADVRTILCAVIAALALISSATAATPQPWQWTPAHAGAKVGGRCAGRGSASAGRYTAFRCVVRQKVLWVKVRQSGSGAVCSSRLSLATVPASCLKVVTTAPAGTTAGASEAVGLAIERRYRPDATYRWQVSLPKCTGGNGQYACTFDDSFIHGAASVLWAASGPIVRFTSFGCVDATKWPASFCAAP